MQYIINKNIIDPISYEVTEIMYIYILKFYKKVVSNR